MVPFGLRLWEKAFQMIPDIWSPKLGFRLSAHWPYLGHICVSASTRNYVSWLKDTCAMAKECCWIWSLEFCNFRNFKVSQFECSECMIVKNPNFRMSKKQFERCKISKISIFQNCKKYKNSTSSKFLCFNILKLQNSKISECSMFRMLET